MQKGSPGVIGPKRAPQIFFSLGPMAPGPSGGPLGVFAALDFFVYVCDPFDKKWGAWGPAPAVGADFSKTRNFGPFWA